MVKDVRNLFRLKRKIDDTTIKVARIFFEWKTKSITPQLKIQIFFF